MNRLPIILLCCGFFFLHACSWSGSGVVTVQCQAGNGSVFQGEKLVLHFVIANFSRFTIASRHNFFISYHLYDRDKKLLAFDNPRFLIPQDIARKKTAVFDLPIYLSQTAGDYFLRLDIVKEGEFWGSQRRWQTPWLKISVRPLVSAEFMSRYLPSRYSVPNPLLNREQYLLRMTLKNCEIHVGDNFFGFSAGSTYPQVWIRDMATLIGYAKLYYPISALKTILNRFLETQSANGEIMDWIDNQGRNDKNTVSSDQESSLVLAAAEVAMDDPQWLDESVGGQPVFSRLEKALDWVWNFRRDDEVGLIFSGFTADWGDVEKSYPDQRAIKWSDRSIPVFSTYTQAKFIQAIRRLIDLARFLGKEPLRLKWQDRWIFLKQRSRQQLYAPQKGYFLIHRLRGDPLEYEFEKEILAVGGNAEAIRAGLLTATEARTFLQVLAKRRNEHQLRTVSFTLLPPYPQDFFSHPLLRFPWRYQNGGEWDWIGGRLLKALYESGLTAEATRLMEEIIAKQLRAFTIYEWEDKSGAGQGAMFYGGAAGSMGEAIWKGYLGFDQSLGRYLIKPQPFFYSLVVDKTADRFIYDHRRHRGRVQIDRLTRGTVCVYLPGREEPRCFSQSGHIVLNN